MIYFLIEISYFPSHIKYPTLVRTFKKNSSTSFMNFLSASLFFHRLNIFKLIARNQKNNAQPRTCVCQDDCLLGRKNGLEKICDCIYGKPSENADNR